MSKRISVWVHVLVIASLFIPWTLVQPGQAASLLSLPLGQTGIYRARVTLPSAAARSRLDKLGIKVLAFGTDWANVLVTGDQLATLARLRYNPGVEDELGLLVTRNSSTAAGLAASLRPLLNQAAGEVAGASPASKSAAQVDQAVQPGLAGIIHAFTIDQLDSINALASIDDDGDGLTNTQESWWCTDPTNPYTREDPNKTGVGTHKDGEYVARLLQYLDHPELGDNRLGAPFAGWPMVPGDGHYNPNCLDADYDGVPDLAEMYVIGSNPNAESTAHDRYDDGQKLFGLTPANWGDLPALPTASTPA